MTVTQVLKNRSIHVPGTQNVKAGGMFWMEAMGPEGTGLVCFPEPHKDNRSLCLMYGVDEGDKGQIR